MSVIGMPSAVMVSMSFAGLPDAGSRTARASLRATAWSMPIAVVVAAPCGRSVWMGYAYWLTVRRWPGRLPDWREVSPWRRMPDWPDPLRHASGSLKRFGTNLTGSAVTPG